MAQKTAAEPPADGSPLPPYLPSPEAADIEDHIASFEGRVLAVDERVPMIGPKAVAMHYCAPSLIVHFADRRVEVGDDLRVRYLADVGGGVRAERFAYPDVFVAKGVPRRPGRWQYDVEAEGKAPDFVLQVLTRGMLKSDTGYKVSEYAELGVKEYFLFDPTGELPVPTLHGYRLSRGSAPRRLPETELPNHRRGLYSRELGLYVHVVDPRPPEDGLVEMRWHDPVAGEDLPSLQESMARVREFKSARADRAAARADQEFARAERESDRADRAAAYADRAAARADREAALRRAAERRNAELEARLRQLEGES